VAAVIHHGIDLDAYSPEPGTGGYLLFIGRMSPEKGVHHAVRVARCAGWPLVITAKIREPAERAYFDQQVRPLLGPDDDVLAEQPLAARAALMSNAAALVNPITWPEPFGLVMAQALATATPVLAFPNGAAPEIIDHDRTGFLCRDEDEMTAAVAHIGRAGAQRRQRAEAEAAEARSAALQADARLAEALAAKAAAEQEAAAARARAAGAQQAAEERVAAARQERDDAVAGAESRARDAEQDAARAREAAQSARAELDRARVAADLQVRKIREDPARDQAELRAAFEAQIAAAEDARAALQARAERAKADLQRALASRDQPPEKPTPAQPPGPARRRRRPPQT
jgi:hypothetical protein